MMLSLSCVYNSYIISYYTRGCYIILQMMVWLVDDTEGTLRNVELKCESVIEGDYVPMELRGKPQVDQYRWVSSEEAASVVFPSQRQLFASATASTSDAKVLTCSFRKNTVSFPAVNNNEPNARLQYTRRMVNTRRVLHLSHLTRPRHLDLLNPINPGHLRAKRLWCITRN